MDFEPCHAVIAPGEYCLVYTDGVSEAMNEEKELFTEGSIAEVLDGMRSASPEEVLEGVMNALKAHRGTAAQSDDITMICFKRS
jgi:sigma-B regulation protein RsbU (phosphoserine phosphatase)